MFGNWPGSQPFSDFLLANRLALIFSLDSFWSSSREVRCLPDQDLANHFYTYRWYDTSLTALELSSPSQ